MKDQEISFFEVIKNLSIENAYKVNIDAPEVRDLANALDETPENILLSLPILVKLAHASESEKEFRENFESREYPAIQLTTKEMSLLQGGRIIFLSRLVLEGGCRMARAMWNSDFHQGYRDGSGRD